jgi:hypothetical protein
VVKVADAVGDAIAIGVDGTSPVVDVATGVGALKVVWDEVK